MTKGQQMALHFLDEFTEAYKKENNIKWWHFLLLFPKAIALNEMVGYKRWSIENYPEYIGENGEPLNEVEVDAKLGRDMTKYGFKDSADYFEKVASFDVKE